MENNFDKDQIPCPKYKSGDKVWIERLTGTIKEGEIDHVKYTIVWKHYYYKPTWEFAIEYTIDHSCGSYTSLVPESDIFNSYEECKVSIDNAAEVQKLKDIELYKKELLHAQRNVALYTERLNKLQDA